MIREFLAVGCGGALGSMARHALSHMALCGATWWGFPAGTFTVNVAGSLLIGLLAETVRSQTAVWLLTVGFCGGFTTFSTFSADTLRLLRAGNVGPAAAYVAASVAACLLCTGAGMRIGQLMKTV